MAAKPVKVLGFTLGANLSWQDHIDFVSEIYQGRPHCCFYEGLEIQPVNSV